MKGNRIKRDGFSNPVTEEFFAQHWPDERLVQAANEEKCCIFCLYGHHLVKGDYPWIFCLNPDSGYCYETLDPHFWCVRFEGGKPTTP
jgi:hypothetical protein